MACEIGYILPMHIPHMSKVCKGMGRPRWTGVREQYPKIPEMKNLYENAW